MLTKESLQQTTHRRIVLDAQLSVLNLQTKVKNVCFDATLRIQLKPLVHVWPCFSGR
jgi:hypothetical protein